MNGLIDISNSWVKVVQDEEMKIFSQYHILKTLKTFVFVCVDVFVSVCVSVCVSMLNGKNMEKLLCFTGG